MDKVIPNKTTLQADVLYVSSQMNILHLLTGYIFIHLFYMFFRT